MAKRFTFRLETVLRVRQLREREAKRKVAAQHADIARVDQLSEQTAAEISRQHEALLAGQQQGRLDPITLQRGRVWVACLRRAIATRSAQRAEMAAQLEQLQAAFRAARTQTRIIEKLRERRWSEYARARDHQEQTAADELARQLLDFDPP